MRKTIVALLFCFFAITAFGADPAQEVSATETAFAKAFLDRDQTAFFSYILDDAVFQSAKATMKGKEEIKAVWSTYFAEKEAPFRWRPERVVANGSGTIGVSSGPVTGPKGEDYGRFSSVWVKQKDGSWKVQFDGPGAPPACK
jgi:ketosteroid isomerase-like protein